MGRGPRQRHRAERVPKGAERGHKAGRIARTAALVPIAVLVLGAGTLVTACSSSTAPSPRTPPGRSAPSTTAPPSTSTTGPAGGASAGSPPAVPATGAELGAYLHPASPGTGGGSAFAAEEHALPKVQAAVAHTFAILSLYVSWSTPAPVASLHAIAANGSTPMLAWGCAPSGAALASGADDATVDAFAHALAAYGQPVFLRWCWEMNLAATHQDVGGPTTFVASWDHLRARFAAAGATNVAFVWSPAVTGVDPTPYFPGASEVDWIGVDGYARRPGQTFSSLFSGFVQQWAPQGRPLMVAETGARPGFQAAYLDSVATDLPTLPSVKAVVYFDASGPAGKWALTPSGTAALARLASSPAVAASG